MKRSVDVCCLGLRGPWIELVGGWFSREGCTFMWANLGVGENVAVSGVGRGAQMAKGVPGGALRLWQAPYGGHLPSFLVLG